MDGPPQPTADEIRRAAAAELCPDNPEEAAVIEKVTKGEPLTPQESGLFGWLKKKFRRKSDAPGQPTEAGDGDAPGMGAMASDETEGYGLAPVPVNDALAQRLNDSLVNRTEKIKKRKLEAAARLFDPSAPDKEVARLVGEVLMSDDDKELMHELAPDVARELKMDVRKWAIGIYLGTYAGSICDAWLAIDSFEKRAAKREQQRREKAERNKPKQ